MCVETVAVSVFLWGQKDQRAALLVLSHREYFMCSREASEMIDGAALRRGPVNHGDLIDPG